MAKKKNCKAYLLSDQIKEGYNRQEDPSSSSLVRMTFNKLEQLTINKRDKNFFITLTP